MTTSSSAAGELYANLKAQYVAVRRDFMLKHTPPELVSAMSTLLDNDVQTSNGVANITVRNAANNPVTGSPGTARVSGGVLNSVRLAGAYVQKRVHLNGSVRLEAKGVGVPDSPYNAVSFWARMSAPTGSNNSTLLEWRNPQVSQSPCFLDFTDDPGAVGAGNWTIWDIQSAGSGKTGNGAVWWNNDTLPRQTLGTLVHHLILFDADLGRLVVYLNDVKQPQIGVSANETPFNLQFNGSSMAVGDYVGGDGTFGFVGDLADVWIAPGVNLLDAAGDVPVATRRLFISAGGAPVDPMGFPNGAVLLTGDASMFPVNQGTMGPLTKFGTLTNAA